MEQRVVVDPAAFAAMREREPSLWEPSYGEYSRERQAARLVAVSEVLRASETDQDVVAERVEETMRRHTVCFDAYEGVSDAEEPASFAFVVPSRLSRFTPDFAAEGDELFPIASLLDPVTRQLLWTGAVPLVVDRYRSADGESGVMLACPLTVDIAVDLPGLDALRTAQRIVADTVAFADRRFSARIVGLGAILPKLTEYGAAVTDGSVAVTSGHGGTAWLTVNTVDELDVVPSDVGVIGVGAIGAAIAQELLEHPDVETVHLFDLNTARLQEVADHLGSRARIAESLLELLERCVVTVCAATSPVDLDELDVDLSGRWIVDDSQPSCFDYEQVEARGGRLCWVVGADGSARQTGTKSGYWGDVFDYGGMGPVQPSHFWGCEAEAHAIALAGTRADCITEALRVPHTQRIGELFGHVGTSVAPLQRSGALVPRG